MEQEDNPFEEAKWSVLKECVADRETMGEYRHSQYNELAMQVAKSVEAYSTENREEVAKFRRRLEDALGVLRRIREDANPKSSRKPGWSEEQENNRLQEEHFIWKHEEPLLVYEKGILSEHYKRISPDLIEHAAEYMQRPWMHSAELEWLLVDAIVYADVVEFGEDIKKFSRGGFFGMTPDYFDAYGSITGMKWSRAFKVLERILSFVGIPLFVLYVANKLDFYEDWVITALIVYLPLLIIITLVSLAYRLITRKKRKQHHEKMEAILDNMSQVYYLLNPTHGVINAGYIKERLLGVADKGAAWHGAIFSILDGAIKRDPAVWLMPEDTKAPWWMYRTEA